MTFLHPILAIAGIAAVALPIVIHLLMHRRRKPVMWGAMRFLLEAYRRQRKRLMLEKWLLLATRCLLVLFAALAIARPIIGSLAAGLMGGSGGKTVYFLIDNGIASSLAGADGTTALSRHKAAAYEILDAMHAATVGGNSEGDRVGLITLAAPAEAVVMPASVDLAAVRTLIESITPADSRTDLAGGIALLNAQLASGDVRHIGESGESDTRSFVAVLSDFREGSLDTTAAVTAISPGVRLIATPPDAARVAGNASESPKAGNVGVVTVEPMRGMIVDAALARLAGGDSASGAGAGVTGQQVRVTLRRSGASVGSASVTNVRVELAALPRVSGGGTSTLAPIRVGTGTIQARWAAGQEHTSAIVRLEPTSVSGPSTGNDASARWTGWTLTASIDADDLPADNTAATTLDVRESVRVGIVSPTRFSAEAAAGSGGGVGGLGTADQLDAGAWMRLALSPISRGGAREQEIEIAEIEPASLDAARLSDLDAVVVARPDLVPASAWAALRLMVDEGGLVVVMPPAQATVHLWADAMIRQFGLSWTLAREASAFNTGGRDDVEGGWPITLGGGQPRSSSNNATADANGATTAASAKPENGASASSKTPHDEGSVLRLIRGELPELLPAVHVMKVLPMHGDLSQGEVPLSVAGTTTGDVPLVWIGRPGRAKKTDATNEASESVNTNAGEGTSASRGLVVYLATAMDLSWTDLPAKPLMVPLMQEIVRQGLGDARGRSWWLAGSMPPPPAPAQSVELVMDAGTAPVATGATDTLAAQAASIGVTDHGLAAQPMRHRGVWRAVDGRGVARGVVVVNPDAAGAVVTKQGKEEVAAALGGAGRADGAESGVIWLARGDGTTTVPDAINAVNPDEVRASAIFAEAEKNSPLSRPMLMAALILALMETFLARRASHATVSAGSEAAFAPVSASKEAA